VEGVNRKERGHEGAPPNIASHLSQNEEEQEHRKRVQKNIGKVMAAGF